MANRPEYIATIPPEAGRCVGMAVFNGMVYIACQHGVYYLDKSQGKYEVRPVALLERSMT